jgi:hypothetical protein
LQKSQPELSALRTVTPALIAWVTPMEPLHLLSKLRCLHYIPNHRDQLPDNFIEGEALRDAILAAEPKLAGRVDRYGISPGGEDRYLIGPYRRYRTEKELVMFHTCATDKRIPAARYYECFVFDEDDPAGIGQARAKKKMRAGPNMPVAKRR